MKTTIDIPDALYKRAKIRAIETGTTLKQLVLTSLEHELTPTVPKAPEPADTGSFFERRVLLPEYKAALESGLLMGGTDFDTIISEDRSSRDDALL